MFRTCTQIIVLMVLTCFLIGCSSFTSHGKRETEDTLSNVSDSQSNTDIDSAAGIVPELPDLEPIQEAHNVQITKNDDNTTTIQPAEKQIAKTDNDTPITVVRLPEVQKSTPPESNTEIQQVSYEEPVMEPLPDTPVVTGETRPNQWQSVNGQSTSESGQGSSPETIETTEKSEQKDSLSMDSDSSLTDKTSTVIEPTILSEKSTVKKVTLPKPMTEESKPMDSGVVLEELPENVPNTDSTSSVESDSTTTNNTDIPDEVFELPTLSEELTTSIPLAENDVKTKATEKAEIQQCSAIEPIKQLQISSLTFVTAIRKKGDFTAVAKPYSFKPGQTLLLYMEIENPNFITKLDSGFEVVDSTGKKILAQSTTSAPPTNESSFFQYVKFVLPDKVSSGDYFVRIWEKAPNEKDLASAKLSFKVE